MHGGKVKRELGLLALLAAVVATVSIVNPAFLTAQNAKDILVQVAPFAVLACGMAFVVVLGEIDISIGSMVGLLAVVLGIGTSPALMGAPVGVVTTVMFATGAALGCLNGLLATYGRVPSIIVTLGTLSLFRGATELLLKGEWVTDAPKSFINDTAAITIAAAVVLGTWVVATKTPLGLRVYAAGGNPEAAKVRGLDVKKLRLLAFVTMGLLAALAALISVPQMSVIESGIGAGWELFVVTCVVVGGVSITGGRGSIVGVVIGVLLLGTVRTVLVFLKLGDDAVYWERAIQGAFILVAVLADRLMVKKR